MKTKIYRSDLLEKKENCQEINNSSEWHKNISKGYCSKSPDIINPNSDYAKGFYDGYKQGIAKDEGEKMKIDLDLDDWDNQVLKMDDKQKSEWLDKVNKIHNIAYNLLKSGKISKITFNRIEQIYLINPYRNILLARHLRGTRLNGMFEYKMKFDLTKFNKALFKINQELQKLKDKKSDEKLYL